MTKLKSSLFVAALIAVNGLVLVPPAHADQDLNAARDPSGAIVVYCDGCLFWNCNCRANQT